MGATITTNKAVAGFVRADGQVIYVLFEETYEKNVYPHDPHWGARAIGTYDQVMLRVFQGAASCEGGGLQIRNGHTTPEAYIQRWSEAFRSPVPFEDRGITLELGGTSLYATMPNEKVAAARAKLEAIGRKDQIDRLEAGPAQLQLYRDIEIITALYGVDGPLSLWTIIRNGPPVGFTDQRLVPAARKTAVKTPASEAFKVDEENVVVNIDGRGFKNMGWRYSAIGKYIVDVVLPLELRCSGVAKKMIRDFRAKLYAAPALARETVITVTPSKADHDYYLENAERLAVNLGVVAANAAVPESYQVTFGQVEDAGGHHLLTTLQQAQVDWSLPTVADRDRAFLPAAAQAQPEQHALF